MSKSKILLGGAIAIFGLASTQAQAVSSSFGMQVVAYVPVICNVAHRGEPSSEGGTYNLGQLTEYCNSPQGYSLFVDYTPGTLVGTLLTVGSRSIVLDGSGRVEVDQQKGPKILTADITVKPGEKGFDSGYLTFAVDPN